MAGGRNVGGQERRPFNNSNNQMMAQNMGIVGMGPGGQPIMGPIGNMGPASMNNMQGMGGMGGMRGAWAGGMVIRWMIARGAW